jgi:hypothetical protein
VVDVEWIGMTRAHYVPGRVKPISVLLMHATAGTNSLGWLRQGGAPTAPISCHYLIAKTGKVWQFVNEADTAWHAGASKWRGLEVKGTLNPCSVGIELENLNSGHDPYPDAQILAAVELARQIVKRYDISLIDLVRHRDVSPGRKTDPAPPAFDWPAFVAAVYLEPAAPVGDPYTDESPIMGTPRGTEAQAVAWFTKRTKHYSPQAVAQIVNAYRRVGESVGVDWFLALAQSAHETEHWRSALSARPIRNSAGIGATGAWSDKPQPGYVWDSDRKQYRACVTFTAWTPEEAQGHVSATEAHLGRLLAYALPPGQRFGPQVDLADKALSVRPLPLACHGSAPTLKALGAAHNPTGQGWAYPGTFYAEAIAKIANQMRGL